MCLLSPPSPVAPSSFPQAALTLLASNGADVPPLLGIGSTAQLVLDISTAVQAALSTPGEGRVVTAWVLVEGWPRSETDIIEVIDGAGRVHAAAVGVSEAALGLVRRFLITNMGSYSLTNATILLTGGEELLQRTTMRERYNIYRRLSGKPPLKDELLERKKLVWACQINTSVVVEVVFAVPGLGRLLYDAVLAQDLPVVQGGLLALVTIAVLTTVGAEVVQFALDPLARRAAR